MTTAGVSPDRPEGIRNGQHDTEGGVSEIVGAILLVSLVVVAAGIIAMVLFSQSTPAKIPNVNFMVGSNYPPTVIYLYHNGGDTLRIGEFDVRLDGVSRPYTLEGGGEYWTVGKRLNVALLPMAPIPRQVTLVYNTSAGGAVAIRSASAEFSAVSGTVGPDIIPIGVSTPPTCLNVSNRTDVISFLINNPGYIGDAINQSPTTIGPVIAQAAAGNSVSFYKDNRVDLATGTFFRFTVTKSGASISATDLGPKPVSLGVGDVVTVNLRPNTGFFKAFGLGDQLWELSATGVDVNVTFIANGTSRIGTNGDIIHTWVTGYRDLGSTLSIVSNNPYTSGAALVVNGTMLINGQNSDNVAITNIRPIGIGLFVLDGDNNAHVVYFVGNAQSVTINGLPVSV